ncbi:hypothetical protein N8622_02520 [bacterium]|jgi:hypothetical protein|nr:hypothetical protein [bacterium]|tara:strand:+ start:350 stop:682 length:333 start_codon:yes stop_codon:yes gene_type:complete
MKNIVITIAFVLLVGCAKNDLKLVNSGTNDWQQIQINGGGQQFKIDLLKAGESRDFRFKSIKEDGGLITGNLNGEAIKSSIGYFTPNMGNNIEILLDDQGGIKIKNLPRK